MGKAPDPTDPSFGVALSHVFNAKMPWLWKKSDQEEGEEMRWKMLQPI